MKAIKKAVSRLKSKAGESIVEVLVALLIASLGMVLLAVERGQTLEGHLQYEGPHRRQLPALGSVRSGVRPRRNRRRP